MKEMKSWLWKYMFWALYNLHVVSKIINNDRYKLCKLFLVIAAKTKIYTAFAKSQLNKTEWNYSI